jgi:hypothetical protein
MKRLWICGVLFAFAACSGGGGTGSAVTPHAIPAPAGGTSSSPQNVTITEIAVPNETADTNTAPYAGRIAVGPDGAVYLRDWKTGADALRYANGAFAATQPWNDCPTSPCNGFSPFPDSAGNIAVTSDNIAYWDQSYQQTNSTAVSYWLNIGATGGTGGKAQELSSAGDGAFPSQLSDVLTVGSNTIWAEGQAANYAGSSVDVFGFGTAARTDYSNDYFTALALGPDGAVWAAGTASKPLGSAEIVRFSPDGSSKTATFPVSSNDLLGLTGGPDGALWFTDVTNNAIGRITLSGAVTEYPIPTANSTPARIVTGPDGALWFTENSGNKIGRITTSGTITEYAVPTADASVFGIAATQSGAACNPHGVWFRERDKIGFIAM